MIKKIGFNFIDNNTKREMKVGDINKSSANNETVAPRKGLVEIKFPDVYKPYTYYNDMFNLEIGDRVFVDGKLEGVLGVVVNITYNFKIKLSDYKRVIGKADTNVQGEFNFAGSHFITFSSNALAFEKAITWFKAPEIDEEYVNSSDGSSFPLETLEGLNLMNATLKLARKSIWKIALNISSLTIQKAEQLWLPQSHILLNLHTKMAR